MNKFSALFTIWVIGLSPLWLIFFLAFIGFQLTPLIVFLIFVCSFVALVLLSLYTPSRQSNNVPLIKAGVAVLCINLFAVFDLAFQIFLDGISSAFYMLLVPVLLITATVLFASNLSDKYEKKP